MDTSQFAQQWLPKIESFLSQSEKPLIVVVGPTASGKTGLSVAIAELIERGEIINADSRQLYKGLDIGTAKVTTEEMQNIPHHLLDILDPTEEVTAPQFKRMAKDTIDAILTRKNVPILVGGSMLYISAIIDGLEFAPVVDASVRARLEQEYDKDNGETLYKKLQEVDPETAATFHANNKPYLIRALEIWESTGDKASSQKGQQQCPYDVLMFGLEWPREVIVERIEKRMSIMLEQGWIDEVKQLVKDGYTKDDPAMKSHGYREIMDYLEHEDGNIAALAETIAIKTRQYAKRQMTWWKKDPRIHWLQN